MIFDFSYSKGFPNINTFPLVYFPSQNAYEVSSNWEISIHKIVSHFKLGLF